MKILSFSEFSVNEKDRHSEFEKIYNAAWKNTSVPKLKIYNKTATPKQADKLYSEFYEMFVKGEVKSEEDIEHKLVLKLT